MTPRVPIGARIGLALILIGVALPFAWERWGETLAGHDSVSYEFYVVNLFLASAIFIVAGSITLIRSIILLREDRHRRMISLQTNAPASTKRKPLSYKKDKWLPASARLGIGLIVLALLTYAGVHYWVATRTFVALDMPVSLVPGHIKTGPFLINLKVPYAIEINLDERQSFDTRCSPDNPDSVLQTHWMLFRDGKVAAKPEEPILRGTYLTYFDGEKGIYNLDLEVLSDASCLNSRHPRLRVRAYRDEYDYGAGHALWLSALSAAVGTCLLVLFSITQFQTRSKQASGLDLSERVSQSFHWSRRFPLNKSFSGLPAFSLVAAVVYVAGFAPFWVFWVATLPRHIGLEVHLLKRGPAMMNTESLTEPIVIRLERSRPDAPPKVYLQSRLVAWSSLDGVLKDELRLRPERVVYVAADPDLSWTDVVKVIDIIRGAQADTILLPYHPEDLRRSKRAIR